MRKIVLVLTILALAPTLTLAGWWRTYEGGGRGVFSGLSLKQNSIGEYVVAARYEEIKPCMLKTDSLGHMLWKRSYDLGSCILTFFGECCLDGGVIFAGDRFISDKYYDSWIFKTDSKGDSLWVRRFGGAPLVLTGINCIRQTTDGGYIVIGSISGVMPSDPLIFWLFKLDSQGYTVWEQEYWEYPFNTWWNYVSQTKDGGFIVVGGNGASMSVLKTDTLGATTWVRDYIEYSYGQFILQTQDSGYLIMTQEDQVIKTDSLGEVVWDKTYKDFGLRYAIQIEDRSFLITGCDYRSRTTWPDVLLLKINEQGDSLWAMRYGSKDDDQGNYLCETKDKSIVVTGSANGYNKDGYFISDLFLLKTDSLGLLGIEEPAPVTQADWQVSVPIGRYITLRAPANARPLDLAVFDASGRKVDEVHLAGQTATWGKGYGAGVYFIRIEGDASATTHKVILIH